MFAKGDKMSTLNHDGGRDHFGEGRDGMVNINNLKSSGKLPGAEQQRSSTFNQYTMSQ